MITFSELMWRPGRARGRRPEPFIIDEPVRVDLAGLTHVPIERAELSPESRIALIADPSSVTADRFRFLRMRLRELRGLTKLRSLAITSPLPGDGKSTIAMCVATTLAEGGAHSVLLVEADLHNPSISQSLTFPARAGAAECVDNEADPFELMRKVEPFGWYLLQAGKPSRNPTEIVQSAGFSKLIEVLVPHFDWIILDSPPAIPLTDALALSRQADATMMVVRADRTPREAIEQSIRLIGRKHILGFVLNGGDEAGQMYSRYYSKQNQS